ncbi:MAG: hypothetical protein KJ064_08025 [Anaerolineae bacterium]|nr:hypothetical protein [Anaerolineae bacterium]
MQTNDLLKALFKFDDADLQANRAGKYSRRQRFARYKFAFGLYAFFQVAGLGIAVFLAATGEKTQGILEFLSIMAVVFLPIVPAVAFLARKIRSIQGELFLYAKRQKHDPNKKPNPTKHKLYGGPLYWFEVNGEAFSITDEAIFHALHEIEYEYMTVYYTQERLSNLLLSIESEQKQEVV